MVLLNRQIFIKGKPILFTSRPTTKGGSLTKEERLSSTIPMIHYEKPTFKPVVQDSKSRNFDNQEPIPIHGAGVDMLNALDFRSSKRKSKETGVILKA